MAYHRKRSKPAKPAWMSEYQKQLVALVPSMAGKVDWDTATFMFNEGYDASEAAKIVAESHASQSAQKSL